ncbi:phosphorylase family protein [Humisphaera borealis]|uniref:Nucleoside phosphorylase domain-containing protein n=1 Tax=Humisphaera borealis TaxID=2807512 RepID=A0A7M2WYZ5_9BACT|nr:hypothetical protein [Humisphaera borealis]QOV90695.1 hypothetical protein IPV69_04875 [Humisphaera borealis]
MTRPRLQIFTAIDMERRAVRHALTRAFDSGAARAFDWELSAIGVRAVHLPRVLDPSTTLVVLAGLAGGLDPALRVGDLVLDIPATSADRGPQYMQPVRDVHSRRDVHSTDDITAIAAQSSAVAGRIWTSPQPVATPADKAALFRRTGAVAVDMEGDLVAALARSAGVPFVHLRAISDTAGDAIDPRVLSLVNDLGRPKPLKLAAYLLADPRRVAALKRLGAHANLAVERLGSEVARLMPPWTR